MRVIMSQTWKTQGRNGKDRLWRQLLTNQQVYFIELFQSHEEKKDLLNRICATVEDNMEQNISSLLIIDDCFTELIHGDLPISKLMTNGRSIGLTIISLWQGNMKSGSTGNTIRANQSTIIFFEGMIDVVAKDWMNDDKHFKQRAAKCVKKRTAGVLERDLGNSLFLFEAPKEYETAILGREDWHGKLAGITSSQTKVRRYYLYTLLVHI